MYVFMSCRTSTDPCCCAQTLDRHYSALPIMRIYNSNRRANNNEKTRIYLSVWFITVDQSFCSSTDRKSDIIEDWNH